MPMSYSFIILVNLHSIGYTQLPSYVSLLWLLHMCVDWFGPCLMQAGQQHALSRAAQEQNSVASPKHGAKIASRACISAL